jgi:protoporphyrinogen oxidase
MNSSNSKKRVIVIGAGPAGLTAAFELLHQDRNGYEVTVLEETPFIGGISRTVVYNGNRMDLGGHRFFSKDREVMKWWNERMALQGSPSKDDLITNTVKPLNPAGPDPEKVDRVMLFRNRVSRIYSMRKFFDYPISLSLQTLKNLGVTKTLSAGISYLTAMFHKLPEDSLENFYRNRFGRKIYNLFFKEYTEKVWGRDPKDISAEWGAQRVKGLSIWKVLEDAFYRLLPKSLQKNRKVETSLIEQFWYPKFGPGQLWELTADEIRVMGGTVRHNSKAVGLDWEDGRIKAVLVEEPDGTLRLEADLFISSMPLKDLVRGMGEAVPDNVAEVAAGLPYRDFITVGLIMKKLKLENQTKILTPYNRIPDCWIYMQEPNVKMGRVQIFNNWSPYLVKDFANTVGVGLEYFCSEHDSLWNMADEEFAAFAIDELADAGIINREDVLETHVEHVRKAYPAYFDTYDRIDELTAWLNTFENLYCIGRNGQHRYNNSDHSMATAFEAVKNIRNGVRSRDNIWNVNTEKSYHESSES